MQVTLKATGVEQIYTAPTAGTYTFEIAGASGGKGNAFNTSFGSIPGNGAKLTFSVSLNAGDVLHICIGKQGTGNTGTAKDGAAGGGGGGTFIFLEIPTVVDSRWDIYKGNKRLRILAVAAGGGGTNDESYQNVRGDGMGGRGSAYYSPSNFVAYSTSFYNPGVAQNPSGVMGISQYINYDLAGAFYTRNGSTSQGGYGGGGSMDDSKTSGGGWSGSNNTAYSWCYITSAVGVDGANNGDGYCTITVPDLPPVIDRTPVDVAYYKQQRDKINDPNKGWGSLSDAEKSEWLAANLKGGYWHTDINRVGEAMQHLTGLLNGYGYAIAITARTDWTASKYATAADMAAYLADVVAIKAKFYGTTPLPDTMSKLSYTDANNIEKLLLEIKKYIDNMVAGFKHSGAFNCGGMAL